MVIYKCTNILNDKVYIGQTKYSLKKRKERHKKDSEKPTTRFHEEINKYGWDNFEWEILEKGEDLSLNKLEKEYIEKHKSNNGKYGYNMTDGGSGREGVLRDMILTTPNDFAFTFDYFKSEEIPRQSVSSYVNSGWLEKVDTGLYKKKYNDINILSVLKTLFNYSDLNIHIGGRYIISEKGYSHYIRFEEKVELFGSKNKLPKYFRNFQDKYNYHNKEIFTNDYGIKSNESCLERAVLEQICIGGLEESKLIMQGMNILRPTIVQKLLMNCKHIKTKRLFLYFADLFNHKWVDKLDLDSIYLGKGKRQINKGGKLNKKYKIVI